MNGRWELQVSGIVQGVGFRPFVYEHATRLELSGFVMNTPQGVMIELEGDVESFEQFLNELTTKPPPLAVIKEIQTSQIEPLNTSDFVIRPSQGDSERNVLVSPDYATCSDCLREISDPDDRRYGYPFTNCTNCGPRYTIIHDLPYDRSRTTMSEFEMCRECLKEYEDPTNRRFHTEPTCCPECGPQLRFFTLDKEYSSSCSDIEDCLRFLKTGRIVAIKGLGGFHLVCDAASDDAVSRLRERKGREEKPFAIMVPDLKTTQNIAIVSKQEAEILSGKEKPILLLSKRPGNSVSKYVAPNNDGFGVMLPYTPLHYLLLNEFGGPLVMTSGNMTDEPIAHENDEALTRLSEIADAFLFHNRNIYVRTDDSVVRLVEDKPCFLRRSRGYAPFPVTLPFDTRGNEVLALGPELKNTICVTRNGNAFVSHHIGDLRNAPAYKAFIQAVDHMTDILDVSPAHLVCDRHPDYLSSRYANDDGRKVIEVQHHHAHIASVMAEHGRTDKVIGVAFDGAGLGDNEEVWGGEFLICDLGDYKRAGHIELMPLPGGDAAAKHPDRMAYAYLKKVFNSEADDIAEKILPFLDKNDRMMTTEIIEKNINTPQTSSVGRLFDAAGALLGVCLYNTYEGQTAIELEAMADKGEDGFYEASIILVENGQIVCRSSEIIRGLVNDLIDGVSVETCSGRFHNSVARLVHEMCLRIREDTELSTVALSGGVFANAILVSRTAKLLEKSDFEVLLNHVVPPGDGGVSLGQAAVAGWRLSCA